MIVKTSCFVLPMTYCPENLGDMELWYSRIANKYYQTNMFYYLNAIYLS